MKRRGLRALSLILTAVMVLSVANPGITAYATEVDSVIEQDVVSEETTTEVVTEAATEVVEEVVTTEATTEATTETVTEASTEEATTEAAKEETKKKLEPEMEIPEIAKSKYSSYSDATLLTAVFKDATLCSLVQEITSATTVGGLESYTGALDFTGKSGVTSISSVEGLGIAASATSIDISALTGVTSIPDGEFESCTFSTFVMPTSITSIGEASFRYCDSLTTIKLPNGLTSIGEFAFYQCTALKNINTTSGNDILPSGLTIVGQKAFAGNKSLTTITLPSLSTGLELQNSVGLFSGCTGLTTINISKKVKILPTEIFANAGTASSGVTVSFDTGCQLEKFHSEVFSGAKFEQASLNLANCTSLASIGPSVFQKTTGLQMVVLPSSVSSMEIGNYAFAQSEVGTIYAGSKNSTYSIYLPDYVVSIGRGAFYANTSFTAISLPYGISEIADHLFDDCTALETVQQRQNNGVCNVTLIGDCAFRNTAISNTDFMLQMNQLKQIGRQLVEQYCLGTQYSETFIESLPAGGIDTEKKLDELDIAHKMYGSGTKKECGSEVFTGCTKLATVSIPSSVQVIAARAFFTRKDETSSSISSVTWKNTTGTAGLTRKIYSEAFRNCVNMTTLSLPQNTGENLVIGPCAFYNNASLATIKYNGTDYKKLPNTVTSLDAGAFMNCSSITELHVQSVNGGAPTLSPQVFEGCTSMTASSLPTAVVEIPYHFYALCPLASFNFNEMVNLTKIGELAFFRNQMATIDLSACGVLEEIGGECFANYDALIRSDYMKNGRVQAIFSNDTYILTSKLEKLILPATLERLYFNTGVFSGQLRFDTMHTGSGQEDVVYIPDYVPQGGDAIFAVSGVTKVVWEADTTGDATNRWKMLPVQTFEGCVALKNVVDVLPKYVESIGQRAFAESTVEKADLSSATALKEIGTGSVTAGEKGAFNGCGDLVSVVLPDNSVEGGIKVGQQTFYNCYNLTNVTLGSASSLGTDCFNGCSALPSIDLAKVKTVGSRSFATCSALATVKFGIVETLDANAFDSCTSLVLTGTPLPDTLTKIGNYAFQKASKIGAVVLGAGITEIGQGAFSQSGMTSIDFSNASILSKIGSNAFEKSDLTKFDISGTKVANIESGTLQLCTKLTDASFGEEIEWIKDNALAGCDMFRNFTFYASTTVSQKVFYSALSYNSTTHVTGMGTSDTDDIKISVLVKTPQETIISYGREMCFPYYVNEATTSNIQAIRIYDKQDIYNMDVENLLSVKAEVLDGYYKCVNSDDEDGKYKVSSEYFTDVSEADTAQFKSSTGGNRTAVDVIKVTGLQETTADQKICFEIVANIDFTIQPVANKAYTIKAESFAATYNVRIVDPTPMAVVYTDNQKTKAWSSIAQIQAKDGTRGAATYWYNLEDKFVTASELDNKNIVVETSNPAVIYPAANTSVVADPPTSYTTKATVTNANGTVTTTNANMKFCLVPTGLGTATITLYPEGCTEEQKAKYKTTYTVTVGSDINTLTLGVPTGFNKNDCAPGTEVCVFKEYKNFFGQACTVDNMGDFHNLTNATITFTSNAPDYISVDQYGNAKVLKADGVQKSVRITATVNNSDGKTKTVYIDLVAKHPTVKANQEEVDSATGAKVKVTKVSTTDLQGEVVYEGPSDSSTTNIVIPDTVTINGLRYKVTTIKSGMFKNNKKIQTVSIGNYVKTIEEDAFSGCSNLTTVKIGSEVTTIGKKAFYNCKKLKNLTFASNSKLNIINESAFQNCTQLTKVKIPNSVTRIENKAFYNCKKLKTVTISASASLTNIGSQSFGKCVKLTAITLPKKFNALGTQAFLNCKALKKITVKSTVLSSVGTDALKGIHKKCVIKVPKKKLAQYKTLFANKGQKKSVKIKK